MLSNLTLNPNGHVVADSGAVVVPTWTLIFNTSTEILLPKKDIDFIIWVRHLKHYFTL